MCRVMDDAVIISRSDFERFCNDLGPKYDCPPDAERELRSMARSPTAEESNDPTPPRPSVVATKDQVTPEMRARQRRDPRQWTLTLNEWNAIIEHCINLQEYVEIKKQKRYVITNILTMAAHSGVAGFHVRSEHEVCRPMDQGYWVRAGCDGESA